jgi:hypothetical protein
MIHSVGLIPMGNRAEGIKRKVEEEEPYNLLTLIRHAPITIYMHTAYVHIAAGYSFPY